jgi:hypothetical protein
MQQLSQRPQTDTAGTYQQKHKITVWLFSPIIHDPPPQCNPNPWCRPALRLSPVAEFAKIRAAGTP